MVKFSDIKVGDIVVSSYKPYTEPRSRFVQEVLADSLICCSMKTAAPGYSLILRVLPEDIIEHYRKVEPPKQVALKPRHVEFLRGIPPEGRWLSDHPMRWGDNELRGPRAYRWRELAKRYAREINRVGGPKLKLEGDRLSWVTGSPR